MRYFFHLKEPGNHVVDEEGRELSGIEAAVAAAVAAARSVIASEVMEGRLPLASAIEIEDEQGRRIHELLFRDAVRLDG